MKSSDSRLIRKKNCHLQFFNQAASIMVSSARSLSLLFFVISPPWALMHFFVLTLHWLCVDAAIRKKIYASYRTATDRFDVH